MRRIVCTVSPKTKQTISATSKASKIQDRIYELTFQLQDSKLSEDERADINRQIADLQEELQWAHGDADEDVSASAQLSTRDRIKGIEDRIDEIDAVLADPYVDPDLAADLNIERSELEDDLRFAWADDEAEWDYARQQQEFNPDGSLKGYGDDIYSSTDWKDDPNQDLYVVKIWHEVEANAEDCYGPEAAEEFFDVVANSPEQAIERAKMQWSGPIDRIEIVDVNPEDYDPDDPLMASTDVTAAKQKGVKLQVKFDPYERYGSNKPTKTVTVSGTDVLDALKKMADRMQLYITSEDIEDEKYTAEDVIDRIESENGDGCDFIYFIKNLATNEMLLDADYSEEEDWD